MVLLAQHSRDIVVAYMHRDTVRIFRIPVPRYLTEFYHLVSWNNGEVTLNDGVLDGGKIM